MCEVSQNPTAFVFKISVYIGVVYMLPMGLFTSLHMYSKLHTHDVSASRNSLMVKFLTKFWIRFDVIVIK